MPTGYAAALLRVTLGPEAGEDEGLEFVYSNAEIRAQTALSTTAEVDDDGEAGMGTIELGLLAATFLGAARKRHLPPGRHRAQLTLNGASIADGTVGAEDVAHGRAFGVDDLRRWAVTFREDAQEEAWRRLGEVEVWPGLSSLVTIYDVTGTVITADDEPRPSEPVHTYKAVEVVEAAIGAASGCALDPDVDEPVPPVRITMRWVDDGEEATYTHDCDVRITSFTSHSGGHLPEWTGAEMVEGYCALPPRRRLMARYAAYPSTDLLLHLAPSPDLGPDEGAVAAKGAALDALCDDWDWASEPAPHPDLAVAFEGAFDSPWGHTAVTGTGEDYPDYPAPLSFTYAAGRWAVEQEPPDEDGSPGTRSAENESVLTLPFRWPDADGSIAEVNWAPGGVGGYREITKHGAPRFRAEFGPYVFSAYFGVSMILWREPQDPVPDLPYRRRHELWAVTAYERLAYQGVERWTIEADAAVRDLPDGGAELVVATVGGGFELDQKAWLLRRTTFDHERGRATVAGFKPSAQAPPPALPPLSTPGIEAVVLPYVWDGRRFAVASVSPGFGGTAGDGLDVEVDDGTGWVDVEDHPGYSPNHPESSPGSGTYAVEVPLVDIGPPAEFETRSFRARATWELGATSAWSPVVTTPAIPWP